MKINPDSAKLFERQHARDRMAELSRHIGDDDSDADLFLGHARGRTKEDMIVIGIIAGIVLLLLLYFFVLT